MMQKQNDNNEKKKKNSILCHYTGVEIVQGLTPVSVRNKVTAVYVIFRV